MTEDSNSSTHPLLPPTTEETRLGWLRLLRSRRVGISTFYRLMSECGDAQSALEELPNIARAAGVENYEPCPLGVAQAEMSAGHKAGARLICRGEAEYPVQLSEIPDAPPLLWVIGNAVQITRPCIALVGARNASSLGTRMARALASGLGEAGFAVVSGLARGIDTATHLASLETGTVAVMGGGVDVLYPSENARLAHDICENGGARISEQPMGLQPMARHFPTRNRIISGLSRAVIVIEAAAQSGSLITAHCALDQGRDVLAVPGHPMDARAGGCNILLRDGARLVRSVDDVIEAIGSADPVVDAQEALPLEHAEEVPNRRLRDVAALHQQILDRLGPSPIAEDQLIRDLAAPIAAVSPILTELELDGRIQRQPGGLLARVG